MSRPPWNDAMEAAAGCSVPPIVQGVSPRYAALTRIFKPACKKHDRRYYDGTDGDEEQRLADDICLRADCLTIVRDPALNRDPETGYVATPQDAWTFFYMVQVFGGPNYGTGRSWDGRELWKLQGSEAP